MDFVCDLCGDGFKGKGYLQRHMERCHLKFSCVVCNSVYSQKRNFLDHLRSHFEKFICNYCGVEIYKLERLEQHVLSVHEPSRRKFPYTCRFCERKFPNAIYRNCHERDVHRGREEEESAFKCKHCAQSFLLKDQLRLHTLENHYIGSIFFCPFKECDRYFKTSKLLKTHEKIHGPAGYQCKACNKSFQQSSNYSKHKKRCKGPTETKSFTEEEMETFSRVAKEQFILYGGKLKTNEKLFADEREEAKIVVKIPPKTENASRVRRLNSKITPTEIIQKPAKERDSHETMCDLCGMKIDGLSNLKIHISTNHKETNFPCPEPTCMLAFNLKGNLQKHLKQVHLKERPYQCDACGMKLKTKHHLLNHLKTHGNPEKCPICSVILPNIEAHIKRHQKVKTVSFLCPQCGRECATKQALVEHIQRIHERKPLGKFYTCTICEENFIRNSDLRRHSFVHYQGKIYPCTFPGCVEMFKTSYKLHLHQTVHSSGQSGKSFVCEICSKSYPRQTALYKHRKSHADT